MAFQVFKPNYRGRRNPRLAEMKGMFEVLDADRKLAARIDMSPTNVYYYAKLHGYKGRVYVSNNHDGTSTVKMTDED